MTVGPTPHTSRVPVRVMIVDDHADVRYLLRAILEDAAGEIVVAGEAPGGEEAVVAIDHIDPDVVVLDALMPGRDGFETAALIRARRPDQPILLCSAIVDDAIRERARTAGIAACLPKDAFDDIPATVVALARDGRAPKA
jgi:CheY-like chemotaxis protein